MVQRPPILPRLVEARVLEALELVADDHDGASLAGPAAGAETAALTHIVAERHQPRISLDAVCRDGPGVP